MAFMLTVPAFASNGKIPAQCTCDGVAISPPATVLQHLGHPTKAQLLSVMQGHVLAAASVRMKKELERAKISVMRHRQGGDHDA
jgi:phosphatidylethanolamine-binding protein (PEBP) family uncharacterized protein